MATAATNQNDEGFVSDRVSHVSVPSSTTIENYSSITNNDDLSSTVPLNQNISSTTTSSSSSSSSPPSPSSSSSSKRPRLCRVCNQGEEKSRKLCHFIPTEEIHDDLYLHVFCGKTAAILPHVNRPDLEILTKAGIKNKHGTGVSVTMALQRCRSAKVDDASGREQEYFLSKEFEKIYLAITKEPPAATAEELILAPAPHQHISFQDLDPPTNHTNTNTNTNTNIHTITNTNTNTNTHSLDLSLSHIQTDALTHTDTHTHPNPDGILPNSLYSSQHTADTQHQTSSVTPDQLHTSIDHTQYHQINSHQTHSHYATESNNSTFGAVSNPYETHLGPPTKKQRHENTTDTVIANTHTTGPQTQNNGCKSPYEIEMERLQAVCDRCNGVGYSLVRGVARSDDTPEDDEHFDPTHCSQEQVDHVRVIVITKERQETMEQMSRLLLGKQYGQQLLHFNTSFSYDVLQAWNDFTVSFHQANTNQQKFDLLLGFTHTIKEHDVWMHDHEPGWGGDDMVKQLGQSWSFVLPQPDADLGIDSEYTRPGIIALLEQFKEAVESAQTQNPMQFNFATSL